MKKFSTAGTTMHISVRNGHSTELMEITQKQRLHKRIRLPLAGAHVTETHTSTKFIKKPTRTDTLQ